MVIIMRWTSLANKFELVIVSITYTAGGSPQDPTAAPPSMTAEQLPTLSQAQRDRLAFIEMRLRFFGEIRRQDLVERFDIQSAAATRDLALYKDLASQTSTTTPRPSATSSATVSSRSSTSLLSAFSRG
jgi:hypothetical protein